MGSLCKVILASQSPRRRELASILFNNFDILDTNFVEPCEKAFTNPDTYIEETIEEKWRQLGELTKGQNTNPNESPAYYLVSDTTVFLNGQLLGKPQNIHEAAKMLKMLSAKKHEVYTGFRLARLHEKSPKTLITRSAIQFKKLSSNEIKNYIKSGEPMDKAGAYGFQGLGMQFIHSVDGSYTNVMGLPVEALRQEARSLGIL